MDKLYDALPERGVNSAPVSLTAQPVDAECVDFVAYHALACQQNARACQSWKRG